MQLFRSEDDVRTWSARTDIPIGAVFDVATLWELAKRWYDDRLDLDWNRRSVGQRQAILHDVGLAGPFWELS